MTLAIQDRYADPILDSMMTRDIAIDNREISNELTDYQVNLDIDTKQLFFEAQEGLRFVDENLQELDYWTESFPSIEWIKTSKIIASKISRVRMLYGNPTADDSSDGEATMIFFDHFPGSSIDTEKWDGKTSNAAVSDSILSFGGDNTQDYMKSIPQFGPYVAFRSIVIFRTPSGYIGDFGIDYGHVYYNYLPEHIIYSGTQSKATTVLLNTWLTYEFLNIPGGWVSHLINGAHMINSPFTAGKDASTLEVRVMGRSPSNPIIESDWVLVRKYVSPEPTISMECT